MVSTDTPSLRPSRRGGKFHPGQAPISSPFLRSGHPPSTPESVIHHTPERSSAFSSEVEDDDQSMSGSDALDDTADEEEEDEDEEEAVEHYEDLDRTIAVDVEKPLSHQLDGFPFSISRSRKNGRRVSPGRPGHTPAKMPKGSAFEFAIDETTNFTNTNLLPSTFADETQTFPYLSATSPQKINSLYGSPSTRELSAQLLEKEAKIRQLEEMLAGGEGQDFDEFINYSPEKKISLTPKDPQLTVKKRRSPTKFAPPSLNATPVPLSRNFKSPPVKAFAAMFEAAHLNGTPIRKPKVTKEEVKEAKRRRETMEFRKFSEFDFNQLKGYLPQPPTVQQIVEEQGVGSSDDVQETGNNVEEKETEDGSAQENEKSKEEPLEKSKEEPEDETMDETKEEVEEMQGESTEDTAEKAREEIKETQEEPAEDQQDATEATAVPVRPTTPVAISLTSFRRGHKPSDSAPASPRAPTPDVHYAALAIKDTTIAQLHARIAALEEELSTATIQLEKTGAALVGERRARIAAEETCAFLQTERRFGVCCHWAPGSGKTETEAAASLPLPSSPTGSVVSHATFDDRPRSRIGGRPASRLKGPMAGRSENVPLATSSTVGATKKRQREEPPHEVLGRKPQVGRPEKRVLSAAMVSGNAMLGNNPVSALAKKPEKPAVRGLNRAASGGAVATRALARGARR